MKMSDLYRLEESKLYELASYFRKKYFVEDDDDYCDTIGTCQSVAPALAEFLKTRGYAAYATGGYYTDVPQSYLYFHDPDDVDLDDWDDFDGKWKHWWVIVNNTFIVDITSDQFYQDDEYNDIEDFRVVVTDKEDDRYE